jgi:superfamily II DNA or RNA helicase
MNLIKNMFLSKYNFKGTWREYQAKVLDELNIHLKDKKINIVAAPGSGKTILGLEIVRRLDENVLILAPTITIKNQRVQRFTDMFLPEGENVDWISKDIYNLNRFNVVTYQTLHYALNKTFIKEDEIDLEEEEEDYDETEKKIKTDSIDYDLIKELKNKKIKTIVLDEAHHLRAQWWKSLKYTLDNLEDIAVVSLTATPPYDVEENERKRYEEVCGTIDAEISTPELVATGDLCPHQDYLMFSYVTKAEQHEINTIKKGVQDFMTNLKKNEKFIDMLKNNKIINKWESKENEEIILSNVEYY